jgi:hypothetical protein
MMVGVGGLQGALTDFVAADADLLAHKPKTLIDASGSSAAPDHHHRRGRLG